jgi:hypothetical protein
MSYSLVTMHYVFTGGNHSYYIRYIITFILKVELTSGLAHGLQICRARVQFPMSSLTK